MSEKMTVLVNGIAQVEYRRDVPLEERQRAYLTKMDAQMDSGILLDGETIDQPDRLQRARYVALTLAEAILQDREAETAATCSWLAERIPDLQQVRIDAGEDGQVRVELIFDRPLENQVKVQFPMPGEETRH